MEYCIGTGSHKTGMSAYVIDTDGNTQAESKVKSFT